MRARVGVAAGLAAVAIAAVAIAWAQDVPALTSEDAITATRHALEGAGLDAEVERDPLRTTYRSPRYAAVDVWSVRALVRAQPIEVQLAIADARPVAIDDRTLDRSAYVLSEREYLDVAGRVEDPARERAIRRNIWFTFAAVLVVALGLVHAALAAQPEEAPR